MDDVVSESVVDKVVEVCVVSVAAEVVGVDSSVVGSSDTLNEVVLSARVLVDVESEVESDVVVTSPAVVSACVVPCWVVDASLTCCDVVLTETVVVESMIGAEVTVTSPAVVSSCVTSSVVVASVCD